MARKVFNPLIHLLAHLAAPELGRTIQFLKAENELLRSRLPKCIRTTPAERRRLLRLGAPLGRAVRELISIVTYRTFLRWKIAEGGPRKNKVQPTGRPRKPQEVRDIILRLARENPSWGYTRILGELKKLGVHKISRNTVKNILLENGFDPAPPRGEGTWDEFLRIHMSTLWACDFLTQEVWTLLGKVTFHVLFFIEVATRRVHIAGITASPDGAWVAQQAREMTEWFEAKGKRPGLIIRDGDKKLTAEFNEILESAGARMKRISRKSPNMNPFAEAWVGAIRRECLDRFVLFGEGHLRHIVDSYVSYHNPVRPHQGLGNVPVGQGPPPDPEEVGERDGIVCESWLGGLLRHYRRAG